MTTSRPSPTVRGPACALVLLALVGTAFDVGSCRAASQQDEDACRPDVFRLCASNIPDEGAIVACLESNLSRLDPACRAVMTRDAPVTRPRSGRVVR